MTTQLFTLTPEMSLRDAVEQLSRNHVTGAPVVAGGRVMGTLSANDVLMFVAGTPGVPTEQDEGDPWMEGLTDPWDDGQAPPSTYFTDFWDDAGADVAERFSSVDGPEWDMLDEHIVSEAMSTTIILLTPDTPLHVAAERMECAGVHRVLVSEDGHLLGIVTTMDVTRAFARQPREAESPARRATIPPPAPVTSTPGDLS